MGAPTGPSGGMDWVSGSLSGCSCELDGGPFSNDPFLGIDGGTGSPAGLASISGILELAVVEEFSFGGAYAGCQILIRDVQVGHLIFHLLELVDSRHIEVREDCEDPRF